MKKNKKELEVAFDRLSDEDLAEVLRNLRQCYCLEGAAAGIARQIEDQGRGSLTERQRWRFLEDAWFPFVEVTCDRCSETLQADDMVLAPQMHSGRCCLCQAAWEKLQEE